MDVDEDVDQKRPLASGFISIEVIYFLASVKFGHLLIAFANSLNPDQDQQKVGPDLDPNRLTLIVFLKNDYFEKGQQMTKMVWKITQLTKS